ncbi:MAG: glycosyltransferase family 2 protein [Sphingobacteriaceae bacterium]|nr:glycosyltransferase family 2 protein [Sphingobacteriaceae bacterium]
MISVVILTYNEEINLEDCLATVCWSDDIIVFDSYSTDKTADIAQKKGVRLVQRQFDNYASQRNAALNEVKFKYDWVLMLDADERVPKLLHEEMKIELNNLKKDITLYRMRRMDFLNDKWLRRSSGYPTWFGRLIKVGYVTVKREINEEYHTTGKIGFLKEHLLHYPFNKGLEHWFEKHNKYSSMEAITLNAREYINFSSLFSSDPIERRRVLKQIFYHLPCRPILVFLYLYLFRFGFLDGYPGLIYCQLRAIYESMIKLKIKELKV